MRHLAARRERTTLSTSHHAWAALFNEAGLRSPAIIACGAVLITSARNLPAPELRLLAGGAMSGVWADIKPQFEQASGHKLEIFFGTTPNLIKEATSGKPFDVGVVPVEVMQDASARAKFVAGPTIDIAHVGLGVAVRSGAQKPEIGNADALKATLLKAQSIASIPESATGYSIAKVFDRLGITEPMKAKMRAQPNPAQVVAVVAKGEVELGIFLINVLTAPGLDVVGPFPAELQENVVFTAAVGSCTTSGAAHSCCRRIPWATCHLGDDDAGPQGSPSRGSPSRSAPSSTRVESVGLSVKPMVALSVKIDLEPCSDNI